MPDLKVITAAGSDAALKESVVEELRGSMRGELHCPGNEGY
jgi:hypothetical protein